MATVWIVMAWVLGGAVAMVMGHEAAHAVVTRALGGQVEGLTWRWFGAVGVRLRVDGLSRVQVAWTLLAAPVAEGLVVGALWMLQPALAGIWLALLAAQWGMNLVPWPGVPNDGRRLWQLMHGGRAAL